MAASRGRPPLPGRREEILEAVARVVAERGVDAVTLAGLAGELGLSSYALTYHFGSKDRLVAAVVEHVEARLQEDLRRVAAGAGGAPPAVLLRRYWDGATGPGDDGFLRLWLELLLATARDPGRYPGFLDGAVRGWFGLARDTLAAPGTAPELSTLVVAAVTGLEIYRLLEPDSPVWERALALLADLVTAGSPPAEDARREG